MDPIRWADRKAEAKNSNARECILRRRGAEMSILPSPLSSRPMRRIIRSVSSSSSGTMRSILGGILARTLTLYVFFPRGPPVVVDAGANGDWEL